MVSSARRAVLTGVGLISPIGSDLSTFWRALLEGRSGVKTVRSIDLSNSPVRIGAEVQDFDPKHFLDKKQQRSLKMMARTVQMGVCAAQKTIEDIAMPAGHLDPFRFGVAFGAGMIATELDDIARASKLSTNCQPGSVSLTTWGETGMKEIPPLWMLKYLPNMPACHVSILHDAQGPNNTITESEVASLMALGEAYRILGRDLADLMLVGGCESKMNPLSMVRHTLFQKLSRRNEAPEKALRPFDRDRDGTVLGEGAAVLGLEDLQHAQARGAKIYAEVCGFAAGFDRGRTGNILAKVIRKAMTEAEITPEQVDHVNAHATGIADYDNWEAKAIADVFGGLKPGVPVFAPKAFLGNLGAASGAMELIVAIESLRHGFLPGTINHESPELPAGVHVHTGEPRPMMKPYIVKIGYTDMGQCAAVVLRRWDA